MSSKFRRYLFHRQELHGRNLLLVVLYNLMFGLGPANPRRYLWEGMTHAWWGIRPAAGTSPRSRLLPRSCAQADGSYGPSPVDSATTYSSKTSTEAFGGSNARPANLRTATWSSGSATRMHAARTGCPIEDKSNASGCSARTMAAPIWSRWRPWRHRTRPPGSDCVRRRTGSGAACALRRSSKSSCAASPAVA